MPSEDSDYLVSYDLGGLPIVQHFLDRLRIDSLLEEYVPTSDRRVSVPYSRCLGFLLRNLIVGRTPLYALDEWARGYDPRALGFGASPLPDLNDDRLGRALDKLFDADRGSLLTSIVVQAIREFKIGTDRFHNDSTSITFSGGYAAATGRRIRGKEAVAIRHGHNKDHRPDLKQLLWILTVSADGAVPVHFRLCDGNTNDDVTHIETWDTLRGLAGRPDFIYVADCKLCSRKNMSYIDERGGRFITILPRSRREDAWFRNHVVTHEVHWEPAVARPSSRRRDAPEDIWKVTEAQIPSAEGYRIVWVWSSLLARKQEGFRVAALEKAMAGLDALNTRLGAKRSRFRDRAAVEDAIQGVLRSAGAERWLAVEVLEEQTEAFKQEHRGRPGPSTRYVRHTRSRFRLTWKANDDAVARDAKSDGMYPLITNDRTLSAAQVLLHYKSQPYLEKRHEQLKTVYAVTPAFLKDEGRVEALLTLYFLAMVVQALVERELRQAMAMKGIDALPLYPEERECRAPTADRIFDLFANLQRNELCEKGGQLKQRFAPRLTALQRELLSLLRVPDQVYTR